MDEPLNSKAATAPQPRRPFTIRRLLLTIFRFALALGCMVNFGEGNALVFFVGTVPAFSLMGAASGVPFDRTRLAAALGALAGLGFYLYALINESLKKRGYESALSGSHR